jgi:phage tail-like protein
MAIADNSQEPKARLIELLPAIYQEPGDDGRPNYLPRFLSSFERVLWGVPSDRKDKGDADAGDGLRGKISRLSSLFDPSQAPEEFLPWLASWAALTLRSTLRLEHKRELIANIIPLYGIRGTRAYLEQLLRICIDAPTAIEEEDIPAMQLGKHSTIGEDTYIEGGAPHFFRVRMVATHLSVASLEQQRQLAYEVVELAKPAHTGYEFRIESPQMQIGVHSTLGIDTVLGPAQTV